MVAADDMATIPALDEPWYKRLSCIRDDGPFGPRIWTLMVVSHYTDIICPFVAYPFSPRSNIHSRPML